MTPEAVEDVLRAMLESLAVIQASMICLLDRSRVEREEYDTALRLVTKRDTPNPPQSGGDEKEKA